MYLIQVRTSLSWELNAYGLFFGPLALPPLRESTCMTSSMPRQERPGEDLNHMTKYERSGGLKHMTSDMLEKERLPQEQGCFPSFSHSQAPKTPPPLPCDLLYLAHCPCSAQACLTAYHSRTPSRSSKSSSRPLLYAAGTKSQILYKGHK